MMSAEDEDLDVIMTKLRHLQESRHRRMSRWLEKSDGESASDSVAKASAPSQDNSSTTSVLLQRLQQELVSLLARDDAIFRQLLILRSSISELKMEHQQQQQLCYACSEEEVGDEDETEEDIEMSYLSSSGSSVGTVDKRCTRSLSNDKHDCDTDCDSSFFSFSRYVTCNNNSEDSAISLEFSTHSSSPNSSAPSPTNISPILTPSLPLFSSKNAPSNFHRHNVTYPPTRINRATGKNLDQVQLTNRTCSVSIPHGVDGLGQEQPGVTSTGQAEKNSSFLVQKLVRSKSITFLPRGVLFRREESCDSGFQDSKSCNIGEIFV